MEIRVGSVSFPALRGGGPRTGAQTIRFTRNVERAIAGLTGYSAGFAGGDHHLGQLEVRLDTSIDANNVTVDATLGVRDWSGDWDDDYEGTLQFVVLADLAPIDPSTEPRLDLAITGMEATQSIQHFRSASFLNPPNVRPDNSVRLVARKSTVLRVYVDYDATAGLPPISSLSGVMEVTTSIGSATFNVNPTRSIVPRRDSQISRGQRDHTLNFLIPEAWCQGELTVRCWVFDSAPPQQRSPAFQRTLRFADVAPLRLYGVGVHYTGQGLDLAAPTQAQVMSTMSFVEDTFPVGEVLLTGYSVIDFSRDMEADIDDGCGDGFSALLDRLRDMRGDSGEVYYAVLPSGINTGSVGGCGGGGVGAGFVGGGSTAAQEIGHAFGRDHAPCDSETRCADPSDEDGSYPKYNGFPSDSIGEFGFDTRNDRVLDPAGTFDFMGYSGPTWVSPYTYTGLMGQFPSTSGTSASALRMLRAAHDGERLQFDEEERAEWRKVKMMTLFLGLEVDRDRKVRRRTSFHFPALPGPPTRKPTDLVVEILDADGNVLSCKKLHDDCRHCGGSCWPKSFREQVPYRPGASRLVVRDGDNEIYDEAIPEPPKVEAKYTYDQKNKVFVLKWSAKAKRPRDEDRDDEKDGELRYLVQFEDRQGSWRGVAPRTKDKSMTIPVRLFAGRSEMNVRILASSGISTGVALLTLPVPEYEAPTSEVVVVGVSDEPGPSSSVLEVAVVDSSGRMGSDLEVAWYDYAGTEVGRGRAIDLRELPEGQHLLRAVVLGLPTGPADTTVLVDRGPGGEIVVHKGITPEQERDRDMHRHEPEGRPERQEGQRERPEQKRGRGGE